MKTLQLMVIGMILCFLSAYGKEYQWGNFDGDWWVLDNIPHSDSIWEDHPIFYFNEWDVNDDPAGWGGTELGGLQRPADIEDGTTILLLLALGYGFYCKKRKKRNST